MTSSHSTSDVQTRFLHKLEEVQTNAELKSLLSECPSQTAADHRFYSNLAFFVEHLVPPRGADMSEIQLYIKLPQRLRHRGEAGWDLREKTVAAFKAANKVRR
jgi:hypothetical protein